MNNQIVIRVGGKKYFGWKNLRITQSLDTLVCDFAMSYTDEYISASKTSLYMGEECIVEINGYRLITGYIEEIDESYDDKRYEIQIRGRDRLGDLVDCSYWKNDIAVGEWFNQSGLSIIKALCGLFNIEVEVDNTALSAVQKKVGGSNGWRTNKGDTIFESIKRICGLCAVIPVGYGDGKLTLSRTTTDRRADSKLETGKNIASAKLSQSNLERFSDYVVLGQDDNDDYKDLVSVAQPYGKKEDRLIGEQRYRPIVIVSDAKGGYEFLQNTANWEASTRAGKSRVYECEVNSWMQKSDKPWQINTLVTVNDPILGVETEKLIFNVSFQLDEFYGTKTLLTLVDPKMFKLEIQPEKIVSKNDLKKMLEDLVLKPSH